MQLTGGAAGFTTHFPPLSNLQPASTVHWAKGTIAQGMVMAVFGAVAEFGMSSLFLCSFLTGIVLMLATPASTSAQARVALTDLMAARVQLFERSKGSLFNVHAPDLFLILVGTITVHFVPQMGGLCFKILCFKIPHAMSTLGRL